MGDSPFSSLTAYVKETSPYTGLIILVFVCAGLVFLYSKNTQASKENANVPFVRFKDRNAEINYMEEYAGILAEGYSKYSSKGLPFQIFHPHNVKNPWVILPLKYLNEVKWAQETRLSLRTFIDQRSILPDIGGPRITDHVAHSIRMGMNRALPHLVPQLQEPCFDSFQKLIPACSDWTAMKLHPIILQAVTNMTARAFVGPKLGGMGGPWQTLLMQYIEAAMKVPPKVMGKYPRSLYWVSKYLDDEVKTMWSIRRQVAELLRPELEARIDASKSQSGQQKGRREQEDCIQWLLDSYMAKGHELTPDQLAQDMFILIFASIDGISDKALTVLYDLLEHPNVASEITEEIQQVGRVHPVWTREALSELRIMDSFMRESTRMHCLTQMTALQRLALEPYTFKDGFSVAAGTTLAFPSLPYSLDPQVHTDPEKFDPRRALREREDRENHRFTFGSASGDVLSWGAGRHACPGRFFAQEVLKLVFVHLLTNYEFRNSTDAQKTPLYIPFELRVIPNHDVPVEIREKAKA
jgi:cytochrome P450